MHYLLIIYSAIVILNLFTSKKPNEILAQSVLDLYEVTIGGTIKKYDTRKNQNGTLEGTGFWTIFFGSVGLYALSLFFVTKLNDSFYVLFGSWATFFLVVILNSILRKIGLKKSCKQVLTTIGKFFSKEIR